MIAAFLALAGGAGLAFCQWLVYAWTPVEATLGPIQKIFYMHLPLALWAMASFFLVFLGSILWLWQRKPAFDWLAAAAAELGVLFSGLTLVSGMIWAKRSWGVWWTWDPRLTTA
ncbi:MAG: cytochrome c biogenesis protein CcsA, partial [Desulfovibrio sp.]|nr:cytochrome c biogenesis protein CcsA [Desulfovibrio sp.]